MKPSEAQEGPLGPHGAREGPRGPNGAQEGPLGPYWHTWDIVGRIVSKRALLCPMAPTRAPLDLSLIHI